MSEIVVNDAQADLISSVNTSVAVRDRHGKLLGFVTPCLTETDLAEIKRRLASDEPRLTTEQVMDHLRDVQQQHQQ